MLRLPRRNWSCLVVVLVGCGHIALAEDSVSLAQRAALFTSLPAVHAPIADNGMVLDLRYSNFAQRLQSSDESNQTQVGGRGDIIFQIGGEKSALWKGFEIELRHTIVHGEANFGRGFGQNGVFFPPNTAMIFPRRNETSLTLSQAFANRMKLAFGKFDMIGLTAATPLAGGGGLDTFSNFAITLPVSGILAPYAVGANLSYATRSADYSLMIYDPRNGQEDRTLDFTFEAGISAMLNVMLPRKWGGKPGYHTFTGAINDAKSPDLSAPPGQPSTLVGQWYVAYALQQYLFHDEHDPSKGWGIFARVAVQTATARFVGCGRCPVPLQ